MFYSRFIFLVLLSFVFLGCESGGQVEQPPGKPSLLNASPGNQQIVLAWPEADRAVQYNLYWSTEPNISKSNGQKIHNVTSPYVHLGLSNATTYYYILTSLNAGGESEASQIVAATPVSPPAQPSLNTPVASQDEILLSWDAIPNADTYTLYVANEPGITPEGIENLQGWSVVENVTSPYIYSGLLPGVTYYFALLASNGSGNSFLSAEVSSAAVPPAPVLQSVAAGSQALTIQWSTVPGADDYNLYWATSANVSPSNGNRIESVNSPYTLSGLANGVEVYVIITAVSAGGEGAPSQTLNNTPVPAPTTPVLQTPQASIDTVTLQWDAVPTATGYTLYLAAEPGINKEEIGTMQGGAVIYDVTSPYTHSGLLPGVNYYYALSANNGSGESMLSNEQMSILMPEAPEISGTTALDRAAILEWPAVVGAQTYTLYMASAAGVSPGDNTSLPDNDIIENVTSPMEVAGLVNGRTYYFVLTAGNTSGESAGSIEAEVTPVTPIPIAAGQDHTCAIKEDYSLWCWGRNQEGQLGLGNYGTDFGRTTPTKVGGLNDWNYIAAGGFHSCGIRTNGSLWCWGSNYDGEIGDGSYSRAIEPVQVAGNGWSKVALGSYHTCGLSSTGALSCWGYGGNGQLGTGSSSSMNVPTPVQNSDLPWVEVAAGDRHTCGIKNNNTLWCWGSGGSGRIGDGFTSSRNTPTFVTGTWSKVAAGGSHTCGIRTDGTLRCWGDNEFGQLGNGLSGIGELSLLPSAINSNIGWSDIAAGTIHSCGVKIDGTLWCWGSNIVGQLGLGTVGSQEEVSVPTQVGSESQWSSVTITTGNHTCAYKVDGTSWCWGENEWGQLGDGDGSNATNIFGSSLPVPVNADTDWTMLSVSSDSSCAIKSNGSLWCWGYNPRGNLGDGTMVDKPLPVQVGQDQWLSVSVGNIYTCGVKSDHSLWCWGWSDSTYSRLGLGPNGLTTALTPQQVGINLDWASVSAHNGHTCGLKLTGASFCWGDGASGVLAQDQTDVLDKDVPTPVITALTFSSIDVGSDHTCAIAADNSLWCWGDQYNGETGQGISGSGQPDLYLPSQVDVATDWIYLQTGSNYSCGIKADLVNDVATDQLYCWGDNTSGKLGVGVTGSVYNVPTLVAGDTTSWRTAEVYNGHSCGVKNDDTLWCWGSVGDGQLGIGVAGSTPVPTPTQVGVAEWSVVGVGSFHSCAIKTNGTLWCWGDNHWGQLGNGSLWSGDPLQILFN